MLRISKYWKGVIAGLGPVLLLVQAAVDDSHVDLGEGVGIVTAALVAAGVIVKRNAPPAR